MRAALLLASLAAALPHEGQSPPALTFHHLHLGDSSPAFRIAYYEKMFDRAITERVEFANAQGLKTGTRLILVSHRNEADSRPSALWHFGWGNASLGDTYLAHARREVAWEPPLPAERLHLHVRSIAPRVAAEWFRDVLGALVEIAGRTPSGDQALPAPEHRMPEALVRLGGIDMLIYRTDPPLFSSIGQGIDHLAFSCDNLDDAMSYLAAKRVRVVLEPLSVRDARVAMIEGPDHIAIELVELTRP
jgi:catechol 2,3-dioxygenase-like lactoylglutathione lyase family enzyme